MKNQVLYLLRSKDVSDFKVGISTNIYARASGLPQVIDFDQSLYVECTSLSARKIEQIVHALFHRYRAATHEGEGRTEWFDGKCFEEVKDFLTANAERLGCSPLKQVPIKQSSSILSSAEKLTSQFRVNTREWRAERHQRMIAEWEEGCFQSIQASNIKFRHCLELLKIAVSQRTILGRGYWNHQYREDNEFLVFKPSPETDAWYEYLDAKDCYNEPRITLQFIKHEENRIGFCKRNYSLVNLMILHKDKLLLHTLKRPDEELMEKVDVFVELNEFIDSIPVLDASQETKARRQLNLSQKEICRAISGDLN